MQGVLSMYLSNSWLSLYNANKKITQKMSIACGRMDEGKYLGFGITLLLRPLSLINKRGRDRSMHKLTCYKPVLLSPPAPF